jgi:voltage-gated potassium channel
MGRILNWWIQLQLQSAVVLGVVVLLGLLVLCTVFVHFEEGWNWVDAAYFAITSTTTVAYGDLIPTHEATKIFLIFYLPVGIGVGFTVLASIGAKVIAAQRASLMRTRDSIGQRPNPRDDASRP